MLDSIRAWKHPDTWLGRFAAHLGVSLVICGVIGLVMLGIGSLDVLRALIWVVTFSLIYSLMRAFTAKPGTPFWK